MLAFRQRISNAVVWRDDIANQSLRDLWLVLVGKVSNLGDYGCLAVF